MVISKQNLTLIYKLLAGEAHLGLWRMPCVDALVVVLNLELSGIFESTPRTKVTECLFYGEIEQVETPVAVTLSLYLSNV